MRSNNTGKLIEALVKVQGMMDKVKKDSKNPFFNSNYANLESIVDVIQEPFSLNGIAFSHQLSEENDKHYVTTTLFHLSNEFISSKMRLILNKQDMQALGSAITYAKRYNLCALVGLAETDDDGEASMGRTNKETIPSPIKPKSFKMGPVEIQKIKELSGMAKITKDQLSDLIKEQYKKPFMELNEQDYNDLIHLLQDEAQKETSEK